MKMTWKWKENSIKLYLIIWTISRIMIDQLIANFTESLHFNSCSSFKKYIIVLCYHTSLDPNIIGFSISTINFLYSTFLCPMHCFKQPSTSTTFILFDRIIHCNFKLLKVSNFMFILRECSTQTENYQQNIFFYKLLVLKKIS